MSLPSPVAQACVPLDSKRRERHHQRFLDSLGRPQALHAGEEDGSTATHTGSHTSSPPAGFGPASHHSRSTPMLTEGSSLRSDGHIGGVSIADVKEAFLVTLRSASLISFSIGGPGLRTRNQRWLICWTETRTHIGTGVWVVCAGCI